MTTWHASPELLDRFASEPRSIETVTASSIEQHLLGCESCRRSVAAASTSAGADDLDVLWAEIVDRVDRRQPTLSERLLLALHVGPGVARLVSATPTVRAQALIAMLAVSLGAAWFPRESGGDGIFLAAAPLILLATIALTFAPGAAPAGEIEGASPMHGFGLFWRRAAVVLTGALLSLGVATALLPDNGWMALAWVAPALALTLAAMALGTRFSAPLVAGGLARGWILLVQFTVMRTHEVVLAETALFGPAAQVMYGALALLSVALLVRWRDDLDCGLSSATPNGRFL